MIGVLETQLGTALCCLVPRYDKDKIRIRIFDVRNYQIRRFIPAILILALAPYGCATTSVVNPQSCVLDPVAKYAKTKRAPGLAVAIAVKGELAVVHEYGFSELSEAIPVQALESKFRIGSTSKSLTAFLIAKFHQDERIDIDEPIVSYLPELDTSFEETTIRQLAGHLGGVRHYSEMSELGNTQEYATTADALSIFIDDALVSAPGETFSYSTYGYTLLSAVLERATGESFLSLMEDEVTEPLGLANTVPDTQNIKVPERTEFYYLGEDGNYVVGDTINSSYKWAGGGYLSTAVDLANFGIAHFDDSILGDSSRELLWTSQKTASGSATDYGIGWFIHDGWVEHAGGALGGTTLLRIYPNEEIVVAITANLSMRGPGPLDPLPAQLFECAKNL